MKLPTGDELRDIAIHFLHEGDEHDAAKILAGCAIEIGELRFIRGSTNEIDITLRCSRKTLEKLVPTGPWKDEPEIMKRLKNAICASLPSGYGVANLEARASHLPIKPPAPPQSRGPAGGEALNYDQFTQPESLARLGRSMLKDLLDPFTFELQKIRMPLPDSTLPDAEYFPALSRLLREEAKLPPLLKEKIEEMLELANQIAIVYREENKKELAKYLEIRLTHRATGRGLLGAIADCEVMRQDYPERLTPLQKELVTWLLEYLRDFLDVGNDLEPGDLINYEQEVSDNLEKLEKAGLRVFTGSYRSKQIFENGNSYTMPSSVVLLAATDDPRIKQDFDGTSFIKGLLEKGPARDKAHDTKAPAHAMATQPGGGSAAIPFAPDPKLNPATISVAKTKSAETGPRYLLRRGAGVWRLIFDGKEGEIDHGRGISLVAYLLFNPPLGGLHGTELARLALGRDVLQEASLGADGDSTRRLIEQQAIKWNAVIKSSSASESEKNEAMEQLEKLADTLKVTRAGSDGSADKQVRAVRRAIDRLIEKLRDAKDRKNNPHPALRAFGEHLHKHLWIPSSRFSGTSRSRTRAGVAGQLTYERPADVIWAE